MDFVDLHRCFAPLHKDHEVALDAGRGWGRRIAGWLDWPELLKRRRVVLLAEASCGKTEEFRYQRQRLADEGRPAFLVSIEDLADHGLDASLGPDEAARLNAWKASTSDAYFFFDSVDEARLNRKSFETALRRLSRELGDNLGRAFLFISCRVSDWRGRQDRDAITQHLPVPSPPPPPPPEPETALLAAIFEEEREPDKAKTNDDPDTLLVVQLVPLDSKQHRALAQAAGINDTDDFLAAIEQRGLEALAERPGDLLDLIDYWRTQGCFGSLVDMTEHGVARKLSERDQYRSDNDTLTVGQARQGAERIAAALTLGKTFTIKSPAQDIDPTLAAGALDGADIAPDRKENERNALFRMPCFAPSTYGRIRFHHRSTQEYLTASWFDRLLDAGCPKGEIWPRFFAERYGIETVVPTMRASAAWLSLKHHDFMQEVIRREPLVLIQHGDPGSLPLPAKEKLLAVYAERHAAGEIADDHMDHRAIWMFAQPELADAIRKAWAVKAREDFRRDLLRMVQVAKIIACADLAREALNSPRSEEYTRISALAALDACNDTETLAAVASDLVQRPDAFTPRLASTYSRLLFPKYLSTAQLLHVIEQGRRPSGDSSDGFPSALEDLYRACPNEVSREELLGGLSDLALRPPFVERYQRVSREHQKIAEALGPLARRAVEATPTAGTPTSAVVRTLMAVERTDRREPRSEETPLSTLVRSRPWVNRALFWEDVEEVRAPPNTERLIHSWQVHFGGHTLWELTETDLGWLSQDLTNREHVDDRRLALSAILEILRDTGCLDANLPDLRQSISGRAVLESDLTAYLTPPPQSAEELDFQREVGERRSETARQTEEDKESWRRYCSEISANPERLRDPTRLTSPEGLHDVQILVRWLKGHTGQNDSKRAAMQWQEVTAAFGLGVAEAYRDGMVKLWRLVTPERPQRREGGGITTKWANVFSFSGISIEANLSPGWALLLTPEEAALAVGHACHCEEGYPAWLEPLLDRHTEAVLPVIRQELEAEWNAETDNPGDLLHHLAHSRDSVPMVLQRLLIEIVTGPDAPNSRKAEMGFRILQRIELDEAARRRVACIATARLASPPTNDDSRMLLGLATLFLVDAGAAITQLKAWIDAAPVPQRKTRAEQALARLFGRDHALVPAVLPALSTPNLCALAHFTYIRVSPKDDVHHEGSYTPDTRDAAESARSAILKALLNRPGEEAYLVVNGLADAGIPGVSRTRIRELARGKAERDSEFAPWGPGQVVAMEARHVAPIRTHDDLMRVIVSVLADIQRDLVHEDASLRKLVVPADSEDQVQQWLAVELRMRAKGRFHVHRESEIADRNKPDIVVSAIGATIELVIEVKHGGRKDWTVKKLETALAEQLATDYLRTAARRRGILVITHHGNRTWLTPEDNAELSFESLVGRLQRLAATIRSNAIGSIKAEVVGIDATVTALRRR
jgi:hypothetical protein